MTEQKTLTFTFHTLSENAEGKKFVGYTVESDGVTRMGGHVALGGTIVIGCEVRSSVVFSQGGTKLERLRPFVVIAMPSGYVTTAQFCRDEFWRTRVDQPQGLKWSPSYWMPLPSAPQTGAHTCGRSFPRSFLTLREDAPENAPIIATVAQWCPWLELFGSKPRP